MAVSQLLPTELVAVSDIDKGANTLLAHRCPNVPNLGDFTTHDWTGFECDIVTAGFPCQPVSHAGRRKGTEDERWLFDSIVEAVSGMAARPGLLVFENVRGLLTANGGDAMARVVQGLASIGYVGQWRAVRASDVGAPHGRFRVFIVAHPEGDSWRLGDGDGAAVADAENVGRERCRDARLRRSGSADCRDRAPVALLPTPAVNDMGEGKTVEQWDAWTAGMQAKHGNGNGHGKSLAIEAQRLLPTPIVGDAKGARNSTATRHRTPPTGVHAGDTLGDIAHKQSFGDYAPAIQRWESVTGRPAPEPTERSKTGRRALSPRFVEWLMGLPEGWVTGVPGLSRPQELKLLGNGVVPQQAVAALRLAGVAA